MKVTILILRFDPARARGKSWWQDYTVEVDRRDVVLSALHEISDHQDSTLAYRYSCRGAICGSCAVRINGVAALACKTRIEHAASNGRITLEPLANLPVLRDLVIDQEPFFREMRRTYPWLVEEHHRGVDEPLNMAAEMSRAEHDQFERSLYCIKCACCFSDCPRRLEEPRFSGPEACVDIYKHAWDVRDRTQHKRLKRASKPGGVFDCHKHGNCVKVCPKDVRPMRAITLLQNRIKKELGYDEHTPGTRLSG